MVRLFALGTIATLAAALPATAAPPLVSTAWLAQHLNDPQVRVIATGNEGRFARGHIPGARFLEHMDTLGGGGHRLLPPEKLAPVLAKAGAADGTHIVLYGDSPMTTGWVYMAIASVGLSDVSLLDGGVDLWRSEGHAVSTDAAPAAAGHLTVRPASDIAVDAPWVKDHLKSPAVKILDVRTTGEWNDGHLPDATLILWQDLFADQRTQKFKSPDEIRALFAKAGVQPGQQVVTYCAVGMRASLMYWAARSVGLPARVYVGSWSDWHSDSTNPVAR